jgi:transaldolase
MKERALAAIAGSSGRAHEMTAVSERFHPLQRVAVRIFADGADKAGIFRLYADPLINGLTTNPTLMKRAGISDYEEFAREILDVVRDKPISFEVFSDEPSEMRRQALKIAGWASNVYVKIPITNTRGDSMAALVGELSHEGVKVNVTAVLTLAQVREISAALSESVPAVVSVFAGRIADTGVDPEPYMQASRCLLQQRPLAQLLWASVREVLNIFQANRCGCDIVTVPHEILAKALKMVDVDLEDVSLDTVRMFAADAAAAGFRL